MNPWYLLIDESLSGVLIGLRDPVIANQLRRGVLDARLYWTRESYDASSDAHSGFRKRAFFALGRGERTETFEEKRRLLALRAKAFEIWRGIILDQLRKSEDFYGAVDPYLYRELSASEPSGLMREYARVMELPLEEVMQFSKLRVEENAHKRLMLHALADKYARAINTCRTEHDISAACERMRSDFFKK